MNMHTFRQKEIDRSETMNWTPVGDSFADATEESNARVSGGMTGQNLTRQAYRVGKLGASALMFLTLGVTGLWAVIDLAKIVTEGRKEN